MTAQARSSVHPPSQKQAALVTSEVVEMASLATKSLVGLVTRSQADSVTKSLAALVTAVQIRVVMGVAMAVVIVAQTVAVLVVAKSGSKTAAHVCLTPRFTPCVMAWTKRNWRSKNWRR